MRRTVSGGAGVRLSDGEDDGIETIVSSRTTNQNAYARIYDLHEYVVPMLLRAESSKRAKRDFRDFPRDGSFVLACRASGADRTRRRLRVPRRARVFLAERPTRQAPNDIPELRFLLVPHL